MSDCQWLRHQPCSKLSVAVVVKTLLPTQHLYLINQLVQLPLHDFRIFWETAAPSRQMQAAWQRLCICDHFGLSIFHHCSEVAMLQALPTCPEIVISSHARLDLDWAAVTSQGARFFLTMDDSELCILGGCTIPSDLQDLWQLQLTVRSASSVHGLHGGQVEGTAQVLRNAAVAGWTSECAKWHGS